MRIEQQPLAVFRRFRERARELVERAIVELGRDFDETGHTAESLPSKWSRRPVAPRCVTLRAPIRVPRRSASSSGAPAASEATTVAPRTSPQPVGSPSESDAGSDAIRALRTGRPVKYAAPRGPSVTTRVWQPRASRT